MLTSLQHIFQSKTKGILAPSVLHSRTCKHAFEDVLCEISTQISYKSYKYKALEIIIDIYHREIISYVDVAIVQRAGAESRLSNALERGNDFGAEI